MTWNTTVKWIAAVSVLPSLSFKLSHEEFAEGRALAARLRGRHIETSAKMRINVDAAFIDLVKLIKQYERVSLFCFPRFWTARSDRPLGAIPDPPSREVVRYA